MIGCDKRQLCNIPDPPETGQCHQHDTSLSFDNVTQKTWPSNKPGNTTMWNIHLYDIYNMHFNEINTLIHNKHIIIATIQMQLKLTVSPHATEQMIHFQ